MSPHNPPSLFLVLALAVVFCRPSSLLAEPPLSDPHDCITRAPCEQDFAAGRYVQALPACQACLHAAETLHGPNDESVAYWLAQVGLVLHDMGKYAEAEPVYERSLRIVEKTLGPAHPHVAAALNNLAVLYKDQGRYAAAEPLYTRSLQVREKALGLKHPDVASSLNNLAVLYTEQGRYAAAEPLYMRSLQVREKAFGPDHSDVAEALNNLADLYHSQGRYAQAEPIFQRSLRIVEKALGPQHPRVAVVMNNLAELYRTQGRYSEAEPYFLRSLRIKEKALGPEHPDVAAALNNLAELFHTQGQYVDAEPYLLRSLQISEKALGPEHPNVAIPLNNLAGLYRAQGRYSEAESAYARSLRIMEKALGPEHPNAALSLSNLALLYYAQERYSEAEPHSTRSLRIMEKALGPEHPQVALTLNNLGLMYDALGRYLEAQPLFQRSLRIMEKALGPEHPQVGWSLNNLALAYDAQGLYADAEPYYTRSLRIMEKALGPEHPDVPLSLNNLAVLYRAQGRLDDAVKLSSRILRIRDRQFRDAVGEVRMQALLESLRGEEDALYGWLLGQPADSAVRTLAMTTALVRKGRAMEGGTAANRLLHRTGDSALRQRVVDWQSLRQQREALLYGGLGKLSPAVYHTQLRDLGLKVQSMEAELTTYLPEIHTFQPPKLDELVAAVAAKLPRESVLIEVVLARPLLPHARGTKHRLGPPQYLALLLFPDRSIVSVELGAAADVDSRVRTFREGLQRPDSDLRPAGQALYQQVFQPLLSSLGGVTELYLSLDGTLNIIPFDALDDGSDYLLGRYRFHYLTSGRDLLREPAKRPSGASLLLANPNFGKQELLKNSNAPQTFYQRLSLQPLPGTQREAETLAPLLGVRALLGGEATEAAVRGGGTPRILHIATHGLFLRDVELPVPVPVGIDGGLRGVAFVRDRSKNVAAPEAERLPGGSGAMNRSALALAGVLHGYSAASTADDGLLTAEEARSLDLEGTQLVVLSACETGQGGLSAGQGVYGLRRAFLVAGAETLVTSLWRVHDDATGELMGLYYRKLLDKGKPGDRLGAMVEAMQQLRARPGRSHPYYWAPFLVIGQAGPLRP